MVIKTGYIQRTIYKQPNGRYCVCDYKNIYTAGLTKDDAIRFLCREYLDDAPDILNLIMKNESFEITDQQAEYMGFNKTVKEMRKYRPLKPTDQHYAPPEFCTYGKCPCCGESVYDGIGGKQEKCSNCGQMLDWN